MEDEAVGYLTSSDIPVVNMKKCLPIIRSFVKANSKPPEELPTKVIFAFSYYFDRAAEAGLIGEFPFSKTSKRILKS